MSVLDTGDTGVPPKSSVALSRKMIYENKRVRHTTVSVVQRKQKLSMLKVPAPKNHVLDT